MCLRTDELEEWTENYDEIFFTWNSYSHYVGIETGQVFHILMGPDCQETKNMAAFYTFQKLICFIHWFDFSLIVPPFITFSLKINFTIFAQFHAITAKKKAICDFLGLFLVYIPLIHQISKHMSLYTESIFVIFVTFMYCLYTRTVSYFDHIPKFLTHTVNVVVDTISMCMEARFAVTAVLPCFTGFYGILPGRTR